MHISIIVVFEENINIIVFNLLYRAYFELLCIIIDTIFNLYFVTVKSSLLCFIFDAIPCILSSESTIYNHFDRASLLRLFQQHDLSRFSPLQKCAMHHLIYLAS